MKQYRFKSFKCKIYKDWIYLLPSIEIHTEDMRYYPPEMLSISIHFIILHLRWLWLRKEQE